MKCLRAGDLFLLSLQCAQRLRRPLLRGDPERPADRKGPAALARLRPVALSAVAWSGPRQRPPADRWAAQISEASARFGIPAEWIRRVIRVESGGRALVGGRPIVSSAGAMGLMQLMPGTWRDMRLLLGLGSDPQDPRDNILAGSAYLRLMYDRFGYPGLFAAYHAGPARYAGVLSGDRALPPRPALISPPLRARRRAAPLHRGPGALCSLCRYARCRCRDRNRRSHHNPKRDCSCRSAGPHRARDAPGGEGAESAMDDRSRSMGSGGQRLSIAQEGRLLVERLGGRWSDSGGMCRCPAHEDRTPSLSVRPGRTPPASPLLCRLRGLGRSSGARGRPSSRALRQERRGTPTREGWWARRSSGAPVGRGVGRRRHAWRPPISPRAGLPWRLGSYAFIPARRTDRGPSPDIARH